MSTPSIDEVAAAAGVHKSTVSRAFSRPEAVNRKTLEHVYALWDRPVVLETAEPHQNRVRPKTYRIDEKGVQVREG